MADLKPVPFCWCRVREELAARGLGIGELTEPTETRPLLGFATSFQKRVDAARTAHGAPLRDRRAPSGCHPATWHIVLTSSRRYAIGFRARI